MAKKKGVWDIDIVINGKQVKNTFYSVKKEVNKLKREVKSLTPGTDEFIKKSKELEKAEKHFDNIKEEIHGTNVTLEEFKGHFSTVFDGFLSGNPEKVKQGLQGIRAGLNGLLSSAKAFVLTPIGAAITALVGIGAGLKSWLEFNIEVEKTNEQIQNITQTTGDATDAIRVRAEALKELFGTEINESVEAAKSLAKGFGVSYKEAFDQIESAAVKGKLKNGEFLDSIAEYPVQFKNAGYSVSDFVKIVNTGIDLSIYKDKLPDALKEADLALKEQTKSTTTALTNAFGAQFSKSILKRVKEGKITTKQALQEIAKQSQKVNLNQQQQAQLTADLFKSAGEDAGGAVKVLNAVNIALNKQQKPLTEAQKIRKEELETKKELKSITTQLFASGSEGIGKWIKKGKIFATKTLIKILKGGVSLYNWFVDLNNQSAVFSGLLSSIGTLASSGFKVLGSLIKNAWESFKGLGNVVVGIFTGDWKKIKEGFKQSISFIPNIVGDVKDQVTKDANEIYEAFQGKDKMKRVDLKTFLSTETNEEDTVTNESGTDTPKETNQTKNELTPEDQRILDSKKKLKEFLDEWEEEQAIQKELKDLEGQERAEEEEILRLEKKFEDMELEAGLTREKEAELSEEDKALKVRLTKSKEAQIKAIEDKYKQQRLKDKEKENKQYEKLTQEHHKRMVDAEMQLQYAKQNALDFGIAALKDMFGKKTGIYKALFVLEKALAVKDVLNNTSKSIAQITANTAIANAKAIAASPLTAGMPFVAYNTAIAAKQTLATKLMAGVQIGQIAASTVKGLYPVTREDGKKFNATLGGPTRTQIVSQPTLMQEYLVGERRRPEMIIDDVTYSKLDPRIIQHILGVHKGETSKVPGFEKGDYSKVQDISEEVGEVDVEDSVNTRLLQDISSKLGTLLEGGIEAKALIGDDEIEEYEQRKQLITSTKEEAKIK
ncbi:hypothetical protein SAMN04489761_3081 [Tenacibaculum sp. MAR_2009_124]|uniref:phage tail tape measure protein n=1 Tax=Tenacibaculum sp. MAR_2009_124 TaxID=1250059 RepID=UPI00089C5966|nr:phage tail tape measure protein [Tenacibaculum sp. MAR_2009_124]SEC46985.1 hypothetical protein SAMN04489761_3081 [Tenacibaculum sp. MAR_2009_124]